MDHTELYQLDHILLNFILYLLKYICWVIVNFTVLAERTELLDLTNCIAALIGIDFNM